MNREKAGVVGRPVEMRDNPRKRGTNYSFYLSEDQIQKLEEARWRERKSQSEIVREAIDEWLRNHSEGNSTFKLDVWQEDPEFKAIPTLLSPQEKWSRYIEECSDNELTDIGIMSNRVNELVSMRRSKEYRDRTDNQQNTIRGYYNNNTKRN